MLINARLCILGIVTKSTYEMNGKDLEEIREERDLGVIVQQDLNGINNVRNLLVQPIEY
jgi:hypothetical protein